MQVSRYHKFLRVSLLVTACALVFDSGAFFPVTREFSNTTVSYIASVGSQVLANVPQNEINVLSGQIAEQQRVLDLREAELNEREIASRSFITKTESDYSTYIISTILFIITVLLVLNYAMDWARVRKTAYEESMG